MCSWDNLKLKTNSQLPSEPRNQRHFLSFVLEEGGKKHFWLLIVEECLSKLWSYQAQSVARAGGRCMRLGEVGERDFVGDSKGMGSKNGEERASPSAQILPLLLSNSLTPSASCLPRQVSNSARVTIGTLSGVDVLLM